MFNVLVWSFGYVFVNLNEERLVFRLTSVTKAIFLSYNGTVKGWHNAFVWFGRDGVFECLKD